MLPLASYVYSVSPTDATAWGLITTRVTTEAAVYGKIDKLIGLKENVIFDKLIPAHNPIHAELAPVLSTAEPTTAAAAAGLPPVPEEGAIILEDKPGFKEAED
jgi:hypothetical protein